MEYAKDLGDPRATQEGIVHYGYVVDKRVGDQGRVPQQKPLGVGIAIPKQPYGMRADEGEHPSLREYPNTRHTACRWFAQHSRRWDTRLGSSR